MPTDRGESDGQTVVYQSVEHCSALERNGLLLHATTTMNLKHIMCNERSQPKGYIKYNCIYTAI